MLKSNAIDKIWEYYNIDFFGKPQNRIHYLDKIEFEKLAKEQDIRLP